MLPAALPIGSSADSPVGQTTFAIGNPFGLDWRRTTGIVSSIAHCQLKTAGRTIVAVDGAAVESVARLLNRLDDQQVGETVHLTVLREG